MSEDPRTTIIDMTPDGQFRDPAPPPIWAMRATGVAVLAAIAGGVVLALMLTLWLAIAILPTVLLVVFIALVAGMIRRARRRNAASRGVMRP